MKKTIPILIILFLCGSAFSQKSKNLRVDHFLGGYSGVKYYVSRVTIDPKYYDLEIMFKTDYVEHIGSINNVSTDDNANVIINGYKLGNEIPGVFSSSASRKKVSLRFNILVPITSKTVFFEGLGKYDNNASFDLKPFYQYVQKHSSSVNIDNIKPKIHLNYPKLTNNFYRTEELFITLEGKVTDNMGLMSMMVNGKKVKVSNDGFYKKRLKLKLGKNTVILKAEDINNNTITYDFIIIRDELIQDTEFSDVDYPKATSNKNSNAFAVVFGIESYRNAPSASNAVNDADIFREYLIKRFGLNRENIYLRLDEQATKGEFDKVFSSNGWLYRNTSKNSDVFIYYAGHGAPDLKTKETFLVPYDGDPNYASSTGFSINQLYENLSDLDVKSITLMMDACFTGSSRDNQLILADARPVYIDVQQGNIPSNMIVFTAASGNEISSGYSEKNHGIFTYFILKGLNGNADSNRDRKITVNEMSSYLSDNVTQQARKIGREQNPQMLGSDKNRILLAY